MKKPQAYKVKMPQTALSAVLHILTSVSKSFFIFQSNMESKDLCKSKDCIVSLKYHMPSKQHGQAETIKENT
jgi:hypothetical protein